MDIALLVKLLAPYLPGLMGAGKKLAEAGATAAAKKAGEQSPAVVGKLWQRLWPKVSAKEAAKEAAEDVANDPTDEDALGALRGQLKKVLASDAELAAAVEALMKEAEADKSGIYIQVQGDGNQVIGSVTGNAKVFGSVTGDVTIQG